MKDFEICYEKDPLQPLLLPKIRLNAFQFTYHKYSIITTHSVKIPATENVNLISDSQIIRFLNEIYLPLDPCNPEIYDAKDVAMKDVLTLLWNYTDRFDSRTLSSFTSWCTKSKFPFMSINSARKANSDSATERIRYRVLYVVKDEFIKFRSLKLILDNIAKSIKEDVPKFQEFVKKLKSENYEIIGYARKSHGKEDKETRVRLLQAMVDNMLERTLVNKIYISPTSHADEPFSSRDINCDTNMLRELKNVNGNTQGNTEELSFYIHILFHTLALLKKICLVGVDFAGITTNCADLERLLRQNTFHLRLLKIKLSSTSIREDIN
ncbi:hypothetical protein MFLAVUS_011232 [Mucor flavus]|uniref:Uncharacterized protein n=1 Tax=Mucor flavus TaxID=439312 RepID=A0ABP9ZF48_9FUNG